MIGIDRDMNGKVTITNTELERDLHSKAVLSASQRKLIENRDYRMQRQKLLQRISFLEQMIIDVSSRVSDIESVALNRREVV